MSSALEFAGPARKNLPDKSHVAEKGRVSRSETHCQVQMKSKLMSHNVALPIQSQISAEVSWRNPLDKIHSNKVAAVQQV